MTRIPRTLLGLVILLACPLFRVGTSLAASASHPAPVDDAVLLEESFEIEILSDSEAMVRYLNRTQVLTVAGAEAYGHPAIPYLPAVEIRAIRASNTPPSGKRLEVRKQMISDDSSFPSFELYSDSRQRVIHFPSVVPGSVLEYGYEQAVKNLAYLPHVFPFQEEIPARLKTLSVRYPSSYPLRAAALQGAPEPRREEKDGWVTLRWEARDLSPLRTEAGMPPIGDVSPAIRLFPERVSWGGQTLDLSSWDGIARWHWSLIRERLSPSAEVKQTAQGVVAAGSEPSAALRSLYEFTQKKIRYVAVELGLGSFQPHFNGEVLQHRYGDCKDKASLLIALLRSVDLSAYPVLLRTRDEGKMDRDSPSLSFNHMIVAVPRPEGYLFVDPTAEWTPLGELPWPDQGVLALVVRDDGVADVTETPLASPDLNRRRHAVEARLALNGDLEGITTIDFWGSDRDAMNELRENPTASGGEELVRDLMGWLCPGAILGSHELIAPTGPGDPFRVRVSFRVPKLATRAGGLELLNPHVARFSSLGGLGSQPSRRFPVFFERLSSESAEIRIALPPGMTVKQVPATQGSEGPGMSARSEYELVRDGASLVLVVRRTLRVSRREVPAVDFPALKQFLDSLAREEAGAVTLIAST